MNRFNAIAVVLALLAALVASEVQAEVRRFAVVVGHNRGDVDEQPLQYAERDASRVAEVLERLGNVPPENLVKLLSPDAAAVERVITSISQRIEALEAAEGDETLLFVYYSGHADAFAMHLGGTRLKFDTVKALLQKSPAELRVFVIDACRSGGATRVKGMEEAESFAIDVDTKLASEGLAIITSSSSGEDAQESDRIRGSFFTHHFVSGLIGAADKSGDRRVTLSEAYNYAYAETLRATSKARFVQHPTYSFAMRGRQDLVLTDLDRDASRFGQLAFADGGEYIVFDAAGGEVVAEIASDSPRQLALTAGEYLVRHRTTSSVAELDAKVSAGRTTSINLADMKRVPYSEIVRKGGMGTRERRVALGVSAGGGWSAEVLPGTGSQFIGTAGLQLDLEPITLGMSFRYGQTTTENDIVTVEQKLFGLSLTAFKLFDLSGFTFGLGVTGGADILDQTLTSLGDAPDRRNVAYHAGSLARVGYTPVPWLSLVVDGGGEAWFAQATDGAGETAWRTTLSPVVTGGLILYVR